jgi:N-acetylmuramate 1-kinase
MTERLERARQWLQSTLGVQSVDIQPASSDASFRRYYRVRAGAAPMILMDAPPAQEDCRPYLTVAALLDKAGVHVPAVHARDLDSGFLLLEDLGQKSYLEELDESSAPALYRDALAALIAMQLRVPAACVPPYDEHLVMHELSLFSEWFLGRHLGVAGDARTDEVLAKSFEFLAGEFTRHPRVFVHRDYHSRNLMRTRDHNPGVLDFQDAVAGPAAYDAVSLLRDVYVEWPAEKVEAWLLDYHRDALGAGVALSEDPAEFLRDIDLVGAQRHLKIAGIFCRLFHRDGKADYLRDIPLTLRYLMAECASHPELAELGALLEDLDVAAKLAVRNRRSLSDSGDRQA